MHAYINDTFLEMKNIKACFNKISRLLNFNNFTCFSKSVRLFAPDDNDPAAKASGIKVGLEHTELLAREADGELAVVEVVRLCARESACFTDNVPLKCWLFSASLDVAWTLCTDCVFLRVALAD